MSTQLLLPLYSGTTFPLSLSRHTLRLEPDQFRRAHNRSIFHVGLGKERGVTQCRKYAGPIAQNEPREVNFARRSIDEFHREAVAWQGTDFDHSPRRTRNHPGVKFVWTPPGFA